MHNPIPFKIFIVDDDEILTTALEDFISRRMVCEIKIFFTGEECLKYIHEGPDLIILDYNLNSVQRDAANGIQILESIKKIDRSIHIIMLSSQEAYGIALRTMTKGAEEYVIKDENAFEKIAELCNLYLRRWRS